MEIIKPVEAKNFGNVTFLDFSWLNEPPMCRILPDTVEIKTKKSDFWQKTYYNIQYNTGHACLLEIKDNFTFEVCVEADYNTLYDQAGVIVYLNEKHWLKAGLEYNDAQPMISCVLTNELSDWSTGVFTGDPRKFWIRVTRVNDVICVKYSVDNKEWRLVRLCPFPGAEACRVGPMACSPKRDGLKAMFSGLSITVPADDILHSN